MDWVQEFYRKQDEWSHVYSGDVTDAERERVTVIERLAGKGLKRILELGAGGGQCAAAMAELGHHVTAIELVPTAAAHAQQIAMRTYPVSLSVVQGDFYEVALADRFDVVCYWDGFGIGTDQDQRRLLKRIAVWLVPDGCALIDINTPWYWAQAAGREMRHDSFVRRYDFDAQGCRLLDRWWLPQREDEAVMQSLRCYSPADLTLLLEGTGLCLEGLEAGGAVNYDAMTFEAHVPLGRAMQYTARLVPL